MFFAETSALDRTIHAKNISVFNMGCLEGAMDFLDRKAAAHPAKRFRPGNPAAKSCGGVIPRQPGSAYGPHKSLLQPKALRRRPLPHSGHIC
jgi:hypothetical protein